MRRCAHDAPTIAPGTSCRGKRPGTAMRRNHHIPAPQRKQGDMPVFLANAEHHSTRNAPGLKNRGLRAATMKNKRHQQRAGSVSDRSLAASIRRSAPSSVASRHLLPQEGERSRRHLISVRQYSLSSIVLQLQPRYRKCVHFRRGAYIEVEKVRTETLRTKGAYIMGSDVRTCRFGVIANLLQLEPAQRRGGRRRQKAICVPLSSLRLSPGRVARGSVDRITDVAARATLPPAYATPSRSTGAKTSLRNRRRTTRALRRPLAFAKHAAGRRLIGVDTPPGYRKMSRFPCRGRRGQGRPAIGSRSSQACVPVACDPGRTPANLRAGFLSLLARPVFEFVLSSPLVCGEPR
jgi:hypothetical protein